MTKANTILALVEAIQSGHKLNKKQRELVSKILLAFGQVFFEKTGMMFISGVGKIDETGLPDHVIITPTFGVDVRQSAFYLRKESNG